MRTTYLSVCFDMCMCVCFGVIWTTRGGQVNQTKSSRVRSHTQLRCGCGGEEDSSRRAPNRQRRPWRVPRSSAPWPRGTDEPLGLWRRWLHPLPRASQHLTGRQPAACTPHHLEGNKMSVEYIQTQFYIMNIMHKSILHSTLLNSAFTTLTYMLAVTRDCNGLCLSVEIPPTSEIISGSLQEQIHLIQVFVA